jgi:hypothetical protein
VNRDAAAVGDPLCEDETPDGTFTNKIAIGKRGEIARLAKSFKPSTTTPTATSMCSAGEQSHRSPTEGRGGTPSAVTSRR